jgi:hypothetical protein
MVKLITTLHAGFFENDRDNMAVTGLGFAISAVCILGVFLLY